MSSDLRSYITHALANFRHAVFLVVLVTFGQADGLGSSSSDVLGESSDFIIGFFLVEGGPSHGHELVSVSGGADLLAVLGCGLNN